MNPKYRSLNKKRGQHAPEVDPDFAVPLNII